MFDDNGDPVPVFDASGPFGRLMVDLDGTVYMENTQGRVLVQHSVRLTPAQWADLAAVARQMAEQADDA